MCFSERILGNLRQDGSDLNRIKGTRRHSIPTIQQQVAQRLYLKVKSCCWLGRTKLAPLCFPCLKAHMEWQGGKTLIPSNSWGSENPGSCEACCFVAIYLLHSGEPEETSLEACFRGIKCQLFMKWISCHGNWKKKKGWGKWWQCGWVHYCLQVFFFSVKGWPGH